MSILLTLSLLISVAFGRTEINYHPENDRVEDEYVVTYHSNTTVELAENHWSMMESYGVQLKRTYNFGSFKGFAAKITDAKVLGLLQDDPMVKCISANIIFKLDQLDCSAGVDVQPWGISRVTRETLRATSAPYPFNGGEPGKGVHIYIIDTGVYVDHSEFTGRTAKGANYVTNEDDSDRNGHGTHCAGTAAGSNYGLARGATIVPVKVLNGAGSGTFDAVIAGVEFVVNDPNEESIIRVGSMSLGAQGTVQPLSDAVKVASDLGYPIVVAAGNSYAADACLFTPAGIDEAITVGSTDQRDAMSAFSNIGECLTVFAPGSLILSSWIGNPTATREISGTSMACPHVAGQVAALKQEDPTASTDRLKEILRNAAIKNRITGIPNTVPGRVTPNLLLWNGCNPDNPGIY